jgi:hypothetical protein
VNPAERGGPRLAFALLLALVLALQFAPALGLIGYRLTSQVNFTLIGAARDVGVALLAGLAALGWLTGQRQSPANPGVGWGWVLLAVIAAFTLATDGTPLVLALNLRRLGLMPLVFIAVSLLPWTPRQVDRALGLVVATCALVAGAGLAELLAPSALWTDWLRVSDYTAASGLDRFGRIPFEDSGRFFSGDLNPWIDRPLRRMVSTYLEPTTLAAAMALLLVMAQARRARGHRAGGLLLLALVGGLATVSKGFALFLLLVPCWRALGLPSPRHLVPLSLCVCALAWAWPLLTSQGGFNHVEGLISALDYLAEGHLLGEGIGNAGNYTDSGNDVGGESGLGNAIGQMGIAGVLPVLWAAAIARAVLATAAARRDPGGPWLAAWLLFWVITFLLSASSLGVGGNALGFIVLALYLHPASDNAPA